MANCEDVSARMVELLYGELPADARSGVDAHVAGCARCRSELQELEKTRAVTRQALDESPPPRARVEILRRAAEHLAAQQPAAAAAAAAPIVPAGKTKKATAPDHGGLWDWLRSRWTVPSLATVGAVALLVIGSRVLLEPANVDYKGSPEFQREARQAAAPTASPPPAEIAPLPTPAKGEAPGADKDTAAQPAEAAGAADSRSEGEIAADGRGGAKVASASRRSRAKAEENAVAAAPPRLTATSGSPVKKRQVERDRADEGRFAPPPPPKPVTGFKMDSDDAAVTSTPGARHRSASAPSDGAKLDQLLGAEKPAAAGRPGGLGAGSSVGGYGAGVSGRGKAAERSVAKEHAPREATAPRMAEPAAAPAASPPAAAMPPPATARRESEKKMKRAVDEEAAAGPEEGRAAAKSKASAESAIERANRLFTEGRWAEAAAAYRELLRRDPNNAEAPRWRQRMAVAEAALESRRPTEPSRAVPAQ